MEITNKDFDRSLDEQFASVSSGRARFRDSGGDNYTIRSTCRQTLAQTEAKR